MTFDRDRERYPFHIYWKIGEVEFLVEGSDSQRMGRLCEMALGCAARHYGLELPLSRSVAADPNSSPPADSIHRAAVEIGRRGGLKGGVARAKNLSKEERSESARKAALARWQSAPAPRLRRSGATSD
jgi:hypothetical protein